MGYNKNTQHAIEDIPDIRTFEELIDNLMISEEDKTIMRLHYLDDKNFAFIADYLGYSVSWIKKRHLRILRKVTKLL